MMKYSNSSNSYINAQDLEIAMVKATTYGDALSALREAPSIEITLCKECKYDGTEDCPMDEIYADDFCSYGERMQVMYYPQVDGKE